MTGMANKWRYVAVGVCLAALASGCSSDGGDEQADGTDAGSVPASVPVSAEPDVSSEVVETLAPGDAEQALTEAFDQLTESGYHFVTAVTAGGSLAIRADGDQVGDGTRFVITRDDASAEYVVTPEGTWTRPADGEWAVIDIPTTTANPLPALAEATSVTSVSSDGDTVTLLATVPSSALGYEDDREADVTVTLVDGALHTIQYDTTVQGLAASVLTTYGPVEDDAPVVAPI